MKHTGAVVAFAVAVGVFGAPAVTRAAANKEHQQIMAELRMLQEQQSQLQQMIHGLGETLKVITTKMEDQGAVARKSFADQKLLIDNLIETTRILREKADDTNVRLSSVTQELQALRQTISTMPSPSAALTAPTGDPAAERLAHPMVRAGVRRLRGGPIRHRHRRIRIVHPRLPEFTAGR